MKNGFKQNGLEQFTAKYWSEVREILEAKKVDFDYSAVTTSQVKHWYQGEITVRHDIIYFMLNGYDVAFWHPIMQILSIQDTPRRWGQPMLDKLVAV